MGSESWRIFEDMCTRGHSGKADIQVECHEKLDATRGPGSHVLAVAALNNANHRVVLTGLFFAIDDPAHDPPPTLQIHTEKWPNKAGFTELPHVLEPGQRIEIFVPRDQFYRQARALCGKPGRDSIRVAFWTDNFNNRHTSPEFPFRSGTHKLTTRMGGPQA